MLNFTKSQPSPSCLSREKDKKNGNYRCGNVIELLKRDFMNKCYICETRSPISINVDHFKPHRGDKELKFSWVNLFLSCAHCNNTKSDFFDDIIDCTNADIDIEIAIEYTYHVVGGFGLARFEARDSSVSTLNTVELLSKVFCGETELKKLESSNLMEHLSDELTRFYSLVDKYNNAPLDSDLRAHYRYKVEDALARKSGYTSFKRWIVRKSRVYMEEFSEMLT